MLVPQTGEEQPDNLTKWLLDCLLHLLVSEVNKVEWVDSDRHHFSFSFLFDKFKEYYLMNIFPEFNTTMSIYSPCLGTFFAMQ